MTIHVHQQAVESDEKLIISKGEEEHEWGAATFILPSNSPTSDDDDFKDRSSSCKGVYDASGEMTQICEGTALKDVSKSSIAIANEVAETTRAKYKQLGEKNDIFVFDVFTDFSFACFGRNAI